MQVAAIVPQTYLELTEDNSYHLCLAHLIGAPGMEKYTKFFRNLPRSCPCHPLQQNYVIMDNGVIETGSSMTIDTLVNRAFMINADELVLPDVYKNKEATLAVIDKAHDFIVQQGLTQDFTYMAIPQGSSLKEWIDCADYIVQNYGLQAGGHVTCLGIPKMLVEIAGRDGRLDALGTLGEMHPDLNVGFHIHLLGCWKTPIEIMMLEKAARQELIPYIRGVDSCLPYVYARASKRFSDSDRPDSNKIDFKEGKLHPRDELLLKLNLLAWQDAGDMSEDKTVWFL